mmetsp:Transcript_632/g.1846  ORF Transcript_632/g.1846 Transcript_632/m.1846 type:complete len:122 (+) Transcript_632:92-457(+)|eukprot:CAMPEP_0206140846 /NCGR_PEP_ID=MMETSP1473-20131121/10837_1 /ASSEMBLY_ACC=CAM_ASM_001109 /TAXON_ID=1461547 /ORGANISM="Stichococcus sp, Strain RCC1054" /LENGTH=121 /DNA_ID=CAMNT_0053535163 /DNA_START=16 /DNA_END=381 /DNA_ORIENTATION=-
MAPAKAAPKLFQQLEKALRDDGGELAKRTKGLILFKIDDSEWSLDLRDPAKASVTSGAPPDGDSPDLTLTISDANFEKLVAGKLGPQQAFLLRKLKIKGSMGLAMKLQPILDAAATPQSKL